MGANEEYLDNLLKSVTSGISNEQEKKEDTIIIVDEEEAALQMPETEATDETVADSESAEETFDLDAMLRELNLTEEETEQIYANSQEDSIDEMSKDESEQVFIGDLANLSEDEIDRMIAQSQEKEAEPDEGGSNFRYESLEEEDANVAEIQTLLEKADNDELIDHSVLAAFEAAGMLPPEEEEHVDIMGEINRQEEHSSKDNRQEKENARAQKKAEKERKRQEREERKATQRAAKAQAKEEKKRKKSKAEFNPGEGDLSEASSEDTDRADVALNMPLRQENAEENDAAGAIGEEESDAFSGYQEVDDFDDIEALLGSLNLSDIEESLNAEQQAEVGSGELSAEETGAEESDVSWTDSTDALFQDALDGIAEIDISDGMPVEIDDIPVKEKKVGILKRFVDFLMEEDEEEEPEETAVKEKKDKKKKDKKGNPEEGEEEDEDNPKGGKKDKKAKKPKKEKKPKSEMAGKYRDIEEGSQGKKIGKGGILAIVLIAVSAFAVVYLGNIVFSPLLAKQRAVKAFDAQDYETCYQELSGWELNEKEENMRDYAAVVLKMDRRIETYNQYRDYRKKVEALDALMKAVANYEALYQEALNCGAEDAVEARYDIIIGLLTEEYQLSEDAAKAIAALESDAQYTAYLTAVTEGRIIPGFNGEEGLPGLLPEEEELPDINFAE